MHPERRLRAIVVKSLATGATIAAIALASFAGASAASAASHFSAGKAVPSVSTHMWQDM
jgi:hypothetical protein